MDKGIYAIWYDLKEEDEKEYLSWLHEEYLPKNVLKRSGYLWAASYELIDRKADSSKVKSHLFYTDDSEIPNGTEFLLLIGGLSCDVFLNPNPTQILERETKDTIDMLQKRVGERACIFTEVDRVKGPDAHTRADGGVPAPIIQMGSYNCFTPEDDFDLSSWYAQHRLPEMKHMRGAVGARKLVSAAGWAKHSIFYEFSSLDKVVKYFPRADILMEGENDWTYHVCKRLLHAPGSPTRAKRIWPVVE
tara:strand:+ start:489 stop:1229 length:741 start_codon:yes stop_codon:yes gene_type:complete